MGEQSTPTFSIAYEWLHEFYHNLQEEKMESFIQKHPEAGKQSAHAPRYKTATGQQLAIVTIGSTAQIAADVIPSVSAGDAKADLDALEEKAPEHEEEKAPIPADQDPKGVPTVSPPGSTPETAFVLSSPPKVVGLSRKAKQKIDRAKKLKNAAG
ncbi:hypothetical protein PHYBOEH_000254 [Phytophthora boehmeriae]|uniref:Uncharacterized protein n=1 Tax=Phytophthora boehmeriae TaxID=109152 RepID=A0A8T1VGS1_9STRA|nr:hypothetical protein PHYBOEH_000254 [Phytophthora boehmeriae]